MVRNDDVWILGINQMLDFLYLYFQVLHQSNGEFIGIFEVVEENKTYRVAFLRSCTHALSIFVLMDNLHQFINI